MKKYLPKIFIYFFIAITLFSCNNDKKIFKLLNSDNLNDVIAGAIKAGNSGEKKYVPLLLSNADDLRTSTSIDFYGVSVYKAKMDALEKIFKKKPPTEIIFNKVDSLIISFYTALYMDEKK